MVCRMLDRYTSTSETIASFTLELTNMVVKVDGEGIVAYRERWHYHDG